MAFRDLDNGKVPSGKNAFDTSLAGDLQLRVSSYALTKKEKQIVFLVLQGMSNKEIARAVSIAEQTVKDHLKHVYGKMGVHQRTALYAKVLGIEAR